MKRVLITGGAGFQGSYLTKALVMHGCKVTVLNTYSTRSQNNLAPIKKDINLVWGSVTDKEVVNKTIRGQDVVFHMASHINVDESIKDPVTTIKVNVLGTLNVLEAVRKQKNRLIHISTCEVYGETFNEPIKETRELKPQSPYAASKAAVDRLCYAYSRTYKTKVNIIRPFNVFGPRQKDQRGGALISKLIHQALEKKPLTVFGSGKQTRDYIYIDDLIKAYLLILDNELKSGEVINFGTGKETSIIEIAEFIAKKLKTRIKFIKSRPGEVNKFIADISKAKKLGFKPRVNIWQGIDKCIAWQKKNFDYEEK